MRCLLLGPSRGVKGPHYPQRPGLCHVACQLADLVADLTVYLSSNIQKRMLLFGSSDAWLIFPGGTILWTPSLQPYLPTGPINAAGQPALWASVTL